MSDQPSGAQANADVTEAGLRLGEEYDRNREERANQDDTEKLGEGRKRTGGAVVTGEGYSGEVTLYPGAGIRGLADDETSGGVAARAAKGLDTGDITTDDSTWTAQSARGYVSSNAEDVPGQTFTADELPDPKVVGVSALPSHSIPAALVVDAQRTDNLNTSQERGGDAGTGPAKEATRPVLAPQARREEASTSPEAAAAPGEVEASDQVVSEEPAKENDKAKSARR